ncbi:MAG: hypothetical protein V2I43_01565 [Parvularcula sp.]|nr:hypothetical protein [Parvularcula sp.]
MAVVLRLIVALLLLPVLALHALAPVVKITQITNPYVYSLLSGADPLVTAYVDAGWVPVLLLLAATLLLVGTIVGVLKGERWAAGLFVLAAFADAASLYFAETMGYTSLGLGFGQVALLGLLMVVIFVIVRSVTRRV